MRFPVDDWQFWAATGIVVVIVVLAVRALRPGRRRGTDVTLTIGGRKPDRRRR